MYQHSTLDINIIEKTASEYFPKFEIKKQTKLSVKSRRRIIRKFI